MMLRVKNDKPSMIFANRDQMLGTRGMKWFFLFGLLSSLCLTTSGATSLDVKKAFAVKQRVFPQGACPDKAAFDILTVEDRQLLMQYLWSLDDKSELALLGDSGAREKIVQDFWKKPRQHPTEMLVLKDPEVISMVGELLFKEEQYESPSDVTYPPTQHSAALVIFHTVGNSPSFDTQVINWARALEDREFSQTTVVLLRSWYRANEAKLKAGDFKAVQPGAEPPARTASAADGGPSSTVADASQPGSTPAASPGISKTPESSGNIYAWIAALLITICGGLVWLLKSQRS